MPGSERAAPGPAAGAASFGDVLPRYGGEAPAEATFNFGLGDIRGVPRLDEVVLDAAREAAAEFPALTEVLPGTAGLRELNERLAAIDGEELGRETGPHDVVLTSGACDGLVLSLFAATAPGDAVLYAAPGFPYWWVFSNTGRETVPIVFERTEDYRISFGERVREALETHPRARALVLNEPQNPIGECLDRSQLEILRGLLAAGRIEIIADDVARSQLDPADGWWRTIDPDACWVVGSFTKRYAAPGLRLGWIRSRNEKLQRVRNIAANWRVGVSRPLARFGALLAERLGRGEMVTAEISKRRRSLADVIARARGYPKISPGSYGIYALIDCRRGGREAEGPRVLAAASNAGVRLMGADFLFPGEVEADSRRWMLRLSVGGEARVAAGVDLLFEVAEKLRW